jgi:hypothetical protein
MARLITRVHVSVPRANAEHRSSIQPGVIQPCQRVVSQFEFYLLSPAAGHWGSLYHCVRDVINSNNHKWEAGMFRSGILIVCFLGALMFAPRGAHSLDCSNDPDCPCRDWANVLENLEWTFKNQAAYACADVKIRSGSSDAYNAFRDCNDTFSTRNGVTGVDTGEMYKSCSAYVCNWFISKRLSPACY